MTAPTSATAGRAALLPVIVLLASCALPARRDAALAPDPAPPRAEATPTTEVASPAPTALPAPDGGPAAAPTPPADAWARLRAAPPWASCDAPAMATQLARHAREGRALESLLQRTLPQLEYVLGRVESAGLPPAFALLPLVESGFRALPARGNRPAGVWQFMPATARDHGLRIDARRDDRLDLVAATDAATRLLQHLMTAFDGDPRLATMAFNTGEFRVRRALRAAGLEPGSDDLSALRVGAITRGHLVRLQALACLVAEPARAGVVLPAPDPSARLVATRFDEVLDLGLAARLSGVDLPRLRALNPATQGDTLRAGAALLLPAPAQQRLADHLVLIPPPLRARWRTTVARAGDRWDRLAVPGIDGATLAAINDRRPDDALPREVLVPARATDAARAGQAAPEDTYVVRSGDSLWRIARRFGVALEDLLRHNGLGTGRLLHPGQVLRIPSP